MDWVMVTVWVVALRPGAARGQLATDGERDGGMGGLTEVREQLDIPRIQRLDHGSADIFVIVNTGGDSSDAGGGDGLLGLSEDPGTRCGGQCCGVHFVAFRRFTRSEEQRN